LVNTVRPPVLVRCWTSAQLVSESSKLVQDVWFVRVHAG
jgi:hypothetical protein